MKDKRWIVPVAGGDNGSIEIAVLADGAIVTVTFPAEVQTAALGSLDACQLGLALLDASREAGAQQAAKAARGGRR